MGFLDSAQGMLDKGVSAAKGAVSGVAVEQHAFVKAFVRMCDEGAKQGWHERNGGNASYRLTLEDAQSCQSFFYDTPSSWVTLPDAQPGVAGEFFLITRAGSYIKNVVSEPATNAGIVQVSPEGTSWRVVWGFKGNGLPSSELPSHLAVHAVRKEATAGAARVLYHVHPASMVALSAVLPAEAKEVTRALWKAMTECIIAIPEGVGALPWMVPGGAQIARATAQEMAHYPACVWALHGMFASAATCDEAFGMVQAIEKAAKVWIAAHSTAASLGVAPAEISDDDLRLIAQTYNLPVNEEFLA